MFFIRVFFNFEKFVGLFIVYYKVVMFVNEYCCRKLKDRICYILDSCVFYSFFYCSVIYYKWFCVFFVIICEI